MIRNYLPLIIFAGVLAIFGVLSSFATVLWKPDIIGHSVNLPLLEQYLHKEKPTMIYAFSTWCTSCKKNHGILALKDIRSKYHIVGLPVNDSQDRVDYFLEKNPGVFDAIVDEKHRELKSSFKVVGIPETFIIAPNKVIVYNRRGELILKEMLDVTN